MRAILSVAVVAFVAALGVAADPPKDTAGAAFTRTKKLKGKVTVEAKNTPLGDILKDISGQLAEDQKIGSLSVAYDIGISQNTRTSVAVKDVTAEEALDKLLKTLDYGYVVVSKDKDRYDGWIKIVKGTARGYEAGAEPKDGPKPGAKPDEKKPTTPPANPDRKVGGDDKADEKKPTDPAAEEDEKTARAKVDAAKKLLDEGKADDAKPLLKYVVKFFAKTKAAEDAKKLLDGIK